MARRRLGNLAATVADLTVDEKIKAKHHPAMQGSAAMVLPITISRGCPSAEVRRARRYVVRRSRLH